LDVKPRWDSYEFPKDPSSDSLTLLVSGDGKAPLSIYQNASIYAGNFNEGVKLNHLIKNQAYILVSEGSVNIEGCLMSEGDGLEITELSVANIQALSNSKILVIDVPI
jgi:redox-sensitive bicupin YhaK (pirin superfamily)